MKFEKQMEKVTKDGEVAVLISPGFGAGWSTWEDDPKAAETLLFHPSFVKAAENKVTDVDPIVLEVFGEDAKGICTSGWCDIVIVWILIGTKFYVHENDGHESLRFRDSNNWHVA